MGCYTCYMNARRGFYTRPCKDCEDGEIRAERADTLKLDTAICEMDIELVMMGYEVNDG